RAGDRTIPIGGPENTQRGPPGQTRERVVHGGNPADASGQGDPQYCDAEGQGSQPASHQETTQQWHALVPRDDKDESAQDCVSHSTERTAEPAGRNLAQVWRSFCA